MNNDEVTKIIDNYKARFVDMVRYTDGVPEMHKMEDALDMAINVLSQEPCNDTVSRGVFEQVMWERDTAIEQLHELGYGLGQKIEPCDDCVSRQAVIDMVRKKQHSREYCIEHHIDFSIDVGAFNVGISSLPPVKPTRAKGKWIFEEIEEGKQVLKCSKCGTIRQRGENSTLEGFIILCENCITLDNFCPHCGADMRGGE